MIFVLRPPCDFLPGEVARMHATWLDDEGARALAPYAIDDATDGLHARRLRPRDALWLATHSLAGLFWGLHDWAHFHHHGPFTLRAWTELQCDAAALAWLELNRTSIGLSEREIAEVRRAVEAVARLRFEDEGLPSQSVSSVAWTNVLGETADPSV